MTTSEEAKTIAQSRVTLSALMGPQDANNHGNVHGGVIMKMVDEVGALAAMRHARAPVVTVVVDSVTFLEPIRVGHLVQCAAELTYVGRTSMEVRVQVVSENPLTGTSNITNNAFLVYVALDPEGRPTPVPRLTFSTDDERRRADEARERQEYRKRMSGNQ
jgi:uncharacterized protein (TIGR00369 family)